MSTPKPHHFDYTAWHSLTSTPGSTFAHKSKLCTDVIEYRVESDFVRSMLTIRAAEIAVEFPSLRHLSPQ